MSWERFWRRRRAGDVRFLAPIEERREVASEVQKSMGSGVDGVEDGVWKEFGEQGRR